MKSFHMVVSGKVQGGNFQAWTQERAELLGLMGWVRNIADGQVEILVQGDVGKIAEFEQLVREKSPAPSISGIKSEWIEYEKTYPKFEIRG